MGINLNRGKPLKYYSSDRISLLVANGLLTFLQRGYSYENFFEDKKDAVYFSSFEELNDKIIYYAKNDRERSVIGFNGKSKYFNLFENTLVTKYMVEKILGLELSKKIIWMN